MRISRGDTSYARQTVDSPNPLTRFAHRRRVKLSIDEAANLAPPGGTIVDYGCGPGKFLFDIGEQRPDLTLVGYDPFAESTYPEVRRVADISAVEQGSVDVLTVLETFEHLYESEIVTLIAEARRILKSDGYLMVSVPVIGGPGLMAKQLNRWLVHSRLDYTPRELLAAVMGHAGARADDIKSSHRGFDFRALHARLAEDLAADRTWFCPFPSLPWGANSQAFSLWRVRGVN